MPVDKIIGFCVLAISEIKLSSVKSNEATLYNSTFMSSKPLIASKSQGDEKKVNP